MGFLLKKRSISKYVKYEKKIRMMAIQWLPLLLFNPLCISTLEIRIIRRKLNNPNLSRDQVKEDLSRIKEKVIEVLEIIVSEEVDQKEDLISFLADIIVPEISSEEEEIKEQF